MRRTARLFTLPAALCLVLGVVACGADEAEPSGGGLASVTIAGEPGKAPEVEWDGRLGVEELQTEVLVPGEGEELATGDEVLAHLWIGNGYTQTVAYSSHGEQGNPQVLTVNDQLSPAILQALQGHAAGARVAVAAPPADAFGEQGNPNLGIGNADDVLFVVDILSVLLDGPKGTERKPPQQAPDLVTEDGVPTGFDVSGRRPPQELEVYTLVQGKGAKVRKGDTVAADYLGVVFGKEKPFDESYSGAPAPFPVGVGAVVKGWDRALTGARVGSRLLLVVPSELGYGKQGRQPDIGPGDDLVFVVDLLGVAS